MLAIDTISSWTGRSSTGTRPSVDPSSLRPRSVIGGAMLIGVATLAAGLLYLLILLVVGQPLSDPVLLAGGAGAGAIYNGILAIATYPIARWVRHATEKQASFGL